MPIVNERTVDWLLASDEPWARYQTYRDLLDRPAGDRQVQQARAEMVVHPLVQGLLEQARSWPGYALKRHNDARHPLYAFSTLADFGLGHDDPGLAPALDRVLARQSADGPFQTRLRLYKRFGGLDGEYWTWMACDAPTLTYALLAMGLDGHPAVERAVQHLLDQVEDNGWRCTAAPELGAFRGPGRRQDPCPVANLYALKVLALLPSQTAADLAEPGIETLLAHWNHEFERKLYLFGAGSDFRKLKYPFVWYDILHVAEVLSRFPSACQDPRFHELLTTITAQADEQGRYTATSMYRAWQGWSFADKKRPSPWLTLLVNRILKRVERPPIA
jgi:hypothetical protein